MSEQPVRTFNQRLERYRDLLDGIFHHLYLGPQWYGYQCKRSAESYAPAFFRCRDRKSFLRVIAELVSLTRMWRCVPVHYFRYGLYRRGVAAAQLENYASSAESVG